MWYPDADADPDDGPADTGPLDTVDVGSDAVALGFRRDPPLGSLT